MNKNSVDETFEATVDIHVETNNKIDKGGIPGEVGNDEPTAGKEVSENDNPNVGKEVFKDFGLIGESKWSKEINIDTTNIVVEEKGEEIHNDVTILVVEEKSKEIHDDVSNLTAEDIKSGPLHADAKVDSVEDKNVRIKQLRNKTEKEVIPSEIPSSTNLPAHPVGLGRVAPLLKPALGLCSHHVLMELCLMCNLNRLKMMKKMAIAAKDLSGEYNESFEEESGVPASTPVPMSDLALLASFGSDNPTHRYRYLDSSN
ncbi:hypothetical protein K2173_006993 [Erythroxylum novogranatense]|uniref:Translocase of chloroplast 159/132 membrane anchor domain-containing protein n=1 Tax=Erythroxylum novogranatense TaxID=1862640 RepID=A0AAV8SYG6_9ROSI|nr:hypothetical protein K2173_006993 [Erythroxylum novogranatense]